MRHVPSLLHITPFRLGCALCLCAALLVSVRQSGNAQNAVAPPSAAANPANVFADDARLAQKVKLRVEGLSLSEMLERLSAKTGVALTAQKDIGNDKVVAFTPACPLRDTLADIAALFNNQWERVEVKDQPVHYRMLRTGRARQYEDSFLLGPKERMIAKMDEMARALGESAQQLHQRLIDDGVSAFLLNPERRLGVEVYALLNSAQKDQLFTAGHSTNIPIASLSPPQQEVLNQWLTAHNQREQKRDDAEHLDQQKDFHRVSEVIPPEQFAKSALRLILTGGGITGTVADVRLQMGANTLLPVRQVRDDKPTLLPRHGNPYTGETVSKQAVLPERADLQTAAKQKQWIDRLRTLAETTGKPILTDYFRCIPEGNTSPLFSASTAPSPFAGEATMQMDMFSSNLRRVWWMRGDSLLLRTLAWGKQRLYEVPDQWLLETSRLLATRDGVPTYTDLGRLLELTPEQALGLDWLYMPEAANHNVGSYQDIKREVAQVVCEANRFNHAPIPLLPDRKQLVEKPVPVKTQTSAKNNTENNAKNDTGNSANKREAAEMAAVWTEVSSAQLSSLANVFANQYPTHYDAAEIYKVKVYCQHATNLVPPPPNPEENKISLQRSERLETPGISAEEKQQLKEEQHAAILKSINYIWYGPHKRDPRFMEVWMQIQGFIHKENSANDVWTASGAFTIVRLPLIVPDNRRDKTVIDIVP